jgi:hypothetical protein
MTVLLRRRVTPDDGQVALLDAVWQDCPEVEGDGAWVWLRAPSLTHPDSPPYPGIAVATRRDGQVDVEVLRDERPTGLRQVHATTLVLGDHGADLEHETADKLAERDLPPGYYDLEVWVDATRPREVAQVAFALLGHRPREPEW